MNIVKKIYYVHLQYYENGKIAYPGVKKKIEGQLSIFKSSGYDTCEVEINVKKINKLIKRMPGVSGLYDWESIIDKIKEPNVVYLRHVYLDLGYIDFLKKLKSLYPQLIVLVEFPTFPYEKERFPLRGVKAFLDYPFFVKDRFYRKKLYKYVDRIVTYSEDENIFGVPTINVQNGLDITSVQVVNPTQHDQDANENVNKTIKEPINLIAVASLQEYHGYERIFEGIKQYYEKNGTRKIIFHVVGSGDIENDLKELVNNLGISDYVIFYGSKTGDELTDIFNKSDIGIGSFGFYKIGLERASSLKTREYLARGLPVISGCRQDIFEVSPCKYHMEFSNDNTPVDIQKIIDFYDELYAGKKRIDVFKEIRKYAEENVTMQKAFAPVMSYLDDRLSGESFS